MANSLLIEETEYVPAPRAGKHFGYTSTHLITLAREGKIDGRKVGARWYLNTESIEAFFKNVKEIRKAQLEQIRAERRAELHTHEKRRTRTIYRKTILQTFVTLVIGLAIGTTGYFGTAQQSASVSQGDASFFERLATALYSFISPNETTHTEITRVASITPTTTEPSLSTIVGTTTHTSLVIASDEIMTTTTVESIRDSFSDEVSVSIDPEHPDTGIIIPRFRQKDGEAYRFLMVPINNQPGG